MIKLEHEEVFGWEAAVRGCRNPKNSWNKSDSYWEDGEYIIGPNDLTLMHTLAKAGRDHGKFLRMIHVQIDVTAPLYWWKEADQYKVGTVTDACSTMHRVHAKEFTLDDFAHEHLTNISLENLRQTIANLNNYRTIYNRWADASDDAKKIFEVTERKDAWLQMIQLLPSSYMQKRTWDLNYEVLRNIYFARKDHKLDEWHVLCNWIETLPYFEELCIEY